MSNTQRIMEILVGVFLGIIMLAGIIVGFL